MLSKQALILGVFSIVLLTAAVNYDEIKGLNNCSRSSLENEDREFLIPSEGNCDMYFYEIRLKNRSSIISITSSAVKVNDEPAIAESSSSVTDKHIIIDFRELTLLKDKTPYTALMDRWIFTSKNYSSPNYYFSRTPNLKINIRVSGNWTERALQFSYEEVPFDDCSQSLSNTGQEITPIHPTKGRQYRPNCVAIFRIDKSPNIKTSSISVVLKYLDIDEGIGEYLLLGAGTNPFEGPPPLFISNSRKSKKKYIINDETAYVVFVSASTRKHHEGFSITWEYSGTKIVVDKEKPHNTRGDDVLQSVQVCIYNITAALIQLNKPKDEQFQEFRNTLADIATKTSQNKQISPSQISIYRVSSIIPKDLGKVGLEEGAMYVMLKIQGSEEGRAAFKWKKLEDIFDEYTHYMNSSTDMFDYKIRRCPVSDHRRSMSSVAFFVIIPVLCCIFLIIWTWKRNPVSDYFTRKKLRSIAKPLGKPQDTNSFPMADNLYSPAPQTETQTIPKMLLTDERGRLCTLDFDKMVQTHTDDDSDVEVFNRNDLNEMQRRSSNVIATERAHQRYSTKRRNSKRPAINEAFVDDEGCLEAVQTSVQEHEIQQREAENPYDSLKSSKSLGNPSSPSMDTKL